MEGNIMGELNALRDAGIAPNFSEIGRRHGLDRHTVAKYWRIGREVEDGRRDKASAFERHADLIRQKAALPGVSKKAIYELLLHRFPGEGLPGYNAFTAFCRKRGILAGPAAGQEPHPRFETPPGQQVQFDWKEDIRMVSRHGEAFDFNVFSATLGYSRRHLFAYSPTRTEDDLLSCVHHAQLRMGGRPREWVTDNMSAVVTVRGGKRVKSKRVLRYFREAGCELQLCKARTPQTKGKDESSNRFLNRLRAYDGDFEDEAELISIIARIEQRCNEEPNETTGVPPDVLFMREKDVLAPLSNMDVLESILGNVSVQRVPSTMLVRAGGRQWSVPRRCIGKTVRVIAQPGGGVVVTMRGEVVAAHQAAGASGKIVYDEAHYAEAIAGKARFKDDDIAAVARRNLELLDGLGEAAC